MVFKKEAYVIRAFTHYMREIPHIMYKNTAKNAPDYTFISQNTVVFLEFKKDNTSYISPGQSEMGKILREYDVPYYVVNGDNLLKVIQSIKERLKHE